ncbi:MAG: helix-turn-helix domain-containing protein [Nitrospira sp.]|jgi:excisionase family DNA binding protein|nr:helix-turn-helix domain-containing protein [Nitrospira sp.]
MTPPSLDQLIQDPAKAAILSPKIAQALLIGLASLQPLLVQRALMGPPDNAGEEDLLTIGQVAARLKLSQYRAYELCRQGELKAIRLGKSVRVKPSDLHAYVAQHGG